MIASFCFTVTVIKVAHKNLLISEIQKAQKLEPFSAGSSIEKKSGNLKELMILLSFQPRAIMKLFYERAAVPIIQIIPFPAVLENKENTCSVPREGAQPGGLRGLCLEPGTGNGTRAGTAVTEHHRIYSGLWYPVNPLPSLKIFSTNIFWSTVITWGLGTANKTPS